MNCRAALRVLASAPLWAAYEAVALPLWIVGVLTIPIAACFRRACIVRPSKVYADQRLIAAWRWPWYNAIFGNEEDGIDGSDWYRKLHAKRSLWKRVVRWSAFRNPTNNMRFWPGVNPVIEPARIRYLGDPLEDITAKNKRSLAWSYTWQGPFSCLRIVFPARGKVYRFWIGWKLRPNDRFGVDISDYRYPRCGFATQLKRVL